jgi:uncharacterized protein with NRDE domain
MCLIALALGMSEQYPFVIAANRDEFLDRPTAALAQWRSPSGEEMLSGRDLRDGGIWMGFSASGRFAMLTNVRQAQAQLAQQPISRGALALAWLQSGQSGPAFAAQVQAQRYQGFNLIFGDALKKQCFYLSNQQFFKPFRHLAHIEYTQSAMNLVAIEMPWQQVYGLSNAALDTPWPKTLKLKQALRESLLAADAPTLIAQNLAALRDAQAAPDDQLPSTGVALDLERALSSAFVSHPADQPRYGTLSSTVAVCNAQGLLSVVEVTHASSAQTQQFQLDWR